MQAKPAETTQNTAQTLAPASAQKPQPIAGRSNFPLYFSCREQLAMLEDDERGRVLMAVLDYTEYGIEPSELSKLEKMVFAGMRLGLDRDLVTYNLKVETGRANGKRGGRPRKDAAAQPATPSQSEPAQSEPAQSEPAQSEPEPVQSEPVGATCGRPQGQHEFPEMSQPTVGEHLCVLPKVCTNLAGAHAGAPLQANLPCTVGATCGRPQSQHATQESAEPAPYTTHSNEQPEPTGDFLNPKKPNPFLKTPTATSTPASTPTSTSTAAATATSTSTTTSTATTAAASASTSCFAAPDASLSQGFAAPDASLSQGCTAPDAMALQQVPTQALSTAAPAGEDAAAAAATTILLFWKNNFGTALPDHVAQCMAEYKQQGCTDDVILYALERMVEAGSKNFLYARKILDEACQFRLFTRADFIRNKGSGYGGCNTPVSRPVPAQGSGNRFLENGAERQRKRHAARQALLDAEAS